MVRKEKKGETIKKEEIEGNKLEQQLEKEKVAEKANARGLITAGVLKKASPSKSVNFKADKRSFTTCVKVRLESEGKKEKGGGADRGECTMEKAEEEDDRGELSSEATYRPFGLTSTMGKVLELRQGRVAGRWLLSAHQRQEEKNKAQLLLLHVALHST